MNNVADDLNRAYSDGFADGYKQGQKDAQPERKTGRWIDNDKINFPQCSECGMWIDVMQQSGEMNYCPNCGSYNGGGNCDE